MHIPVDGRQLWVDVEGAEAGELIVLIADANEIGRRWPATFVAALVSAGYRVVRFDHRDCGASDPVAQPYDLSDMAADVVAIVRHFGADGPAHVVGRSMGAMIGQVLALEHPGRVRSLTLLGATPGLGDEALPTMHEDLLAVHVERVLAGEPEALDARRRWRVDQYRNFSGDRYAFEAARQAKLAAAEIAGDRPSHARHAEAIVASPSRLDRLAEIAAPTLIVHGTQDRVYLPPHAEALAAGIPNATLVMVEGLGHELPDAFGAEFAQLVLDVISGPKGCGS